MRMPAGERDALEQWLIGAGPRCKAFFAMTVEDEHIRTIRGNFGLVVARRRGT